TSGFTGPNIRLGSMRTVTLWGTSNSGTIPGVGTPDFSTGLRSKSTTSTWNSSPQRELTTNPLSGKLGADHRRLAAPEQIKSGPLGLANFKIIPISLLPLGVRIVPSDEPG